VDALNDLIDGFKMDQGWNNDTVLELLKQFLWDRQDKWQHNPMLLDIESYFKTVVSLENQDE
jgi:hypothetical protein